MNIQSVIFPLVSRGGECHWLWLFNLLFFVLHVDFMLIQKTKKTCPVILYNVYFGDSDILYIDYISYI